MPPYASPSAARSDEIAGTLRLLTCLGLGIGLMVMDHNGGWLKAVRARAEIVAQPLWRLAGMPAKLGSSVREDAASRAHLAKENRELRNRLLISNARLARLQAEAAENARLRGLLGAVEQGGLDVQLAPILDIDRDPTRQELMLDIGSRQGVSVGQAVIDAGGVLGQVTSVQAATAKVLLLTDPNHAVPVAVSRNGIRLIAYGRGDRLELANVPTSSDVRVGDVVITSGLGGRFPAGFPVGTIAALRRDESRAFLVGELKPAAQLDRGRDVLLLRPTPAPPFTDAAATHGAQPAAAQPSATAPVPTTTRPAQSQSTQAQSAQAQPSQAQPAPPRLDVPSATRDAPAEKPAP